MEKKKNDEPEGTALYHIKTMGEIKDDQVGKTPQQRMKLARLKDVKDAEIEEYRKQVIRHSCFTVLGLIFTISGLLTTGWFDYEGDPPQITVEGYTVYRKQKWNFSFNGISILIRWCSDKNNEASCVPDISQYRYFDDALNHVNLKWDNEQLQGRYIDIAAEANIAVSLLFNGSMLIIAYEVGNMLFAVVAYVKEPARLVVQLMFLAHFMMTGLAAFICWNFSAGTLRLRDMMYKNSFIPDTKPLCEPSFSNALYWVGFGVMVADFLPFFLIIPPGVDEAAKLKAEQRRLRRVRYEQDNDSTSHVIESVPCDTFNGEKRMGWTAGIISAENNPLQGSELSQADLEVDPYQGIWDRFFGGVNITTAKVVPAMVDPDAPPDPNAKSKSRTRKSRPATAMPGRGGKITEAEAFAMGQDSPEYDKLASPDSNKSPSPSRPATAIGARSPGKTETPMSTRPSTAVSRGSPSPSRPSTAGRPERPGSPVPFMGDDTGTIIEEEEEIPEEISALDDEAQWEQTGSLASQSRPGSAWQGDTPSGTRPGTAAATRPGTALTRPGSAFASGVSSREQGRVAMPGSPFHGRPASAAVGRSLVERATTDFGLMSQQDKKNKKLMATAKGMRPLSALPGGPFKNEYQQQLEDEYAAKRQQEGLPPKAGAGYVAPIKEERTLVDRTMPCPEPWKEMAMTDEEHKEYKRPKIGGRPPVEIKMRVRGVMRVPKQENGRNAKALASKIRGDVDIKSGVVKNPYDPPFQPSW